MENGEHALFNKLILAVKDLQISFVDLDNLLDEVTMKYNRCVELVNEVGDHIPERSVDNDEEE